MQHCRPGSVAGTVSLLGVLAMGALAGPAVAAPAISTPTEGAPGRAQAVAGGVAFTLGATLGMAEGAAYERSYAPDVREFKLSELKWEIRSVVMAGLQGAVDYHGWLRFNVDYRAAVTDDGGEMVDRDWLFIDSGSDDEWTHESRHPDTTVDSGSVIDASVDVRAFSSGTFSLRGILGYRREAWAWSARGGSYAYTWDLNGDGFITPDEYRSFRGVFPEGQLVIDYRQEYSLPYLGAACEGAFGAVQVRGRVLYSPWVSGEDRDYHALRDQHFDGEFSGGEWLGASLAAHWAFLPHWYAVAGVEYERYDEIVGDLTVHGAEGGGIVEDGAGMELETVTLQLGAGYRF